MSALFDHQAQHLNILIRSAIMFSFDHSINKTFIWIKYEKARQHTAHWTIEQSNNSHLFARLFFCRSFHFRRLYIYIFLLLCLISPHSITSDNSIEKGNRFSFSVFFFSTLVSNISIIIRWCYQNNARGPINRKWKIHDGKQCNCYIDQNGIRIFRFGWLLF